MANGILVSYAGYPYTLSSLFPDNGLASLAAVLRQAGHACQVLDLNTVETMQRLSSPQAQQRLTAVYARLTQGATPDDLRELMAVEQLQAALARELTDDLARTLTQRCRRERLDFVGFKLWNGDGYEASLRLAGQLRQALPRLRLFAGGPSVHYCAQHVAQEARAFDAVIDGDGEQALLDLARFAEGRGTLQQIANLVCPDGPGSVGTAVQDLAALPRPDYSVAAYPAVHEGGKLKLFCIDDSRGCPMRCAFCINWKIEGARWRTRTVEQVLAEVRGFRDQLGSRAFRLAGTYSPPQLVRGVCDALVAEGIDVEFGVSLHATGNSVELAQALRRAGCFGVFIGLESGSAEILERGLHKSVTPARQRQALTACQDAGLFVAGSFIHPAPFETPQSTAQTQALMLEHFAGKPRSTVNLCFAGLLPRTTWWHERERYGFELQVSETDYLRRMLRYKIRHLVPPTFWEPLPYSLDGVPQPELARRAEAMQGWARAHDVGVNLPDHDAQVGASLGYSASEFQAILRRNLFCGDFDAMQELVQQANRALSPWS